MANTLTTHYPEESAREEVVLQSGEHLMISRLHESGIRAVNDQIGAAQEVMARISAGRGDFVLSKVVTDNTEGYAVSMPSQDSEGRAQLLGYIAPGQSITIGRSHQKHLDNLPYLSRNHFSVTVSDAGDVTVADLGSSNGTVVSDVEDGDELFKGLRWASLSQEVRQSAEAAMNRARRMRIMGRVAGNIEQPVGQMNELVQVPELAYHEVTAALEASVAKSAYNKSVADSFADVLPKNGIEIQGKKYLIGDIFRYHSRMMLIAFIENERGEYMPRLFYKSHSDGGWRSCPGIYSDGTFSKGADQDDGTYVWGTKPAEAVIGVLEGMEARTIVNGQPDHYEEVNNLFSIRSLKNNNVYNFENESKTTFIPGTPRQQEFIYNSLEPGVGFKHGVSPEMARYRLESLSLPDGFKPDFHNVVRSYTFEHTLLGRASVTVHKAIMGNKDIEWHVASSQDGTVWIDKIITLPESVTSYGTYSTVIKAGALAVKPLEYGDQTKGMQVGEDFKYTDSQNRYVSMRPSIDRMPWVKDYRVAMNIY